MHWYDWILMIFMGLCALALIAIIVNEIGEHIRGGY